MILIRSFFIPLIAFFSSHPLNSFNMKLSVLSLGLIAGLATATPTPTVNDANFAKVAKRASIIDISSTMHLNRKSLDVSSQSATGYASENGGTTGDAGGTTTTVSTYAQFTAAVSSTDKKVVIFDGAITQTADQVKVGSNTSIIGKDSGASFTGFGL